MEQARLSRRDFLRGAGLTGAAAAGMLAFPGAGKAFADDGAADAQSTEATDSGNEYSKALGDDASLCPLRKADFPDPRGPIAFEDRDIAESEISSTEECEVLIIGAGIGGLIVTDALARALDPLVTGGTGSASDSPEMPELLPDRFEPGTLNLPGVYGLRAALRWLEGQDLEALRRREIKLTGHLIARLREMEEDGLKIFGTLDAARQVGVVSVDFPGLDNAEAAFQLERDYGVLTRCGLHCAPLAHRTLGTFPAGTVRFSVGPFTRFEDVDYLQAAVCGVMGV